jgi:stage II sporulation protein AB (anti-sigma F factor)
MLYNRMKLEFLSRPENVSLARIAVASFSSAVDFNVSELEEIKVAVSEAVSNAIIHGYGGEADGVITLTAELSKTTLEITVEDQGVGIEDIDNALEPGAAADSERMGLGFVFMKSFMDEVDVVSQPGLGTKIRLLKKLSVEPYVEN